MKKLLILTLILTGFATQAQKKPLLETKEEVEQAAKSFFDQAMTGPDGSLYRFGQENRIEGSYKLKVTLDDRGKVVSVFVKGREGGNIQMQNKVKDAVKDLKMNFKLPKNKSYSIHYKFKF